MVTRSFGRVIASWHGADAPSDAEWGELISAVRKADLARARGLVITGGGAPSAPQRKALAEVASGWNVPIAVVSDQIAVRFVVSMIAMMTRRIRSFSIDELPAAYAHLALTPEERREAEAFVAELGLPSRRRSLRRSLG